MLTASPSTTPSCPPWGDVSEQTVGIAISASFVVTTDGIVLEMLPVRAFASSYDVDRLIGLVSARASNVSIA